AAHSTTAWVGQDLTLDEMSGFLNSIDNGLLTLAEDGLAVDLVGFAPLHRPKRYVLYGHWKQNAYWSWREMFIQLAFANELIVDLGWPPAAVQLERGLDVAVVDPVGASILLAEAKVEPS